MSNEVFQKVNGDGLPSNWLEILKQANEQYVTENKSFLRDCCKSIFDLSLIHFHEDITISRGNFAVSYHHNRDPFNYAVTFDGENFYCLTHNNIRTILRNM